MRGPRPAKAAPIDARYAALPLEMRAQFGTWASPLKID